MSLIHFEPLVNAAAFQMKPKWLHGTCWSSIDVLVGFSVQYWAFFLGARQHSVLLQANCTLRIRSSDGESTWCLRFILAWELLRERHGEIVRSTPHNSESVWDDQIICVDKDQMWQVWNWGAPGAVGFTFTLRAFTFLDQLPKALKLNYHTLSHSAVGILADERQDWVMCQRASQKIEIC